MSPWQPTAPNISPVPQVSQSIILGIHSNVLGGDTFSSGHAWISVTRNGISTNYGLWPDFHSKTIDNGPETDIRIGLENNANRAANRYYQLSPEQSKKLETLLQRNVTWGHTNNCSSWASDLVYEIVNEDVDADDNMGIETPRELGRNIILLEAKDPTSLHIPKALGKKHAQSSSSK